MNILNFKQISKFRKIFSINFQNGDKKSFVIDNSFRNKSTWTFRSDYESNPVTDPSKLRNKYTNFYYRDIFNLKNLNYKYLIFILSAMMLTALGGTVKIVETLEDLFGSKDNKAKKDQLEKSLPDEPERIKKYFTQAKATTSTAINEDELISESPEDENDNQSQKKSGRVGFRDSRIIAYEDRIRSYSTPDKIFRYFATIQDANSEVYMTPLDFVRSITPGIKQPEGLGLDSFRKIDVRKEKIEAEVLEDSVFYLFGENALINFSDYVFLLTVISTPQKQFEIAFRMFDLNGDGELDVEEFDVVRSIIRSGSAMGKRHRDNTVTGNTLSNLINSSLSKYFFGEHGKKKLTINDFASFQRQLQKEIINLEFNRYKPENGLIREVDFAHSLLMYAEFPANKKKKFLKRVRQKYNDQNSIGISFEDYFAFNHFLKCISDVDTALTFYHLAGAPIDRQTLKHVSLAVANVNLRDHIIDVVFTLFDVDNDGHLSNKEFVMVMKQKLLRGLDKPMDTGFIRLLSAMTKCAKDTILSDIY